MSKGNIGIYKHLSAAELFEWSENAINIILEEIEKLKGKPAAEIFREIGIELKWNLVPKSDYPKVNWFLTEVIDSFNNEEEHALIIPEEYKQLLSDNTLFIKIPRIYCNECESYEIPICKNCGNPVRHDKYGHISCDCGAPVKLTCGENHPRVELTYWYIPTAKFLRAVNNNVQKVYKDSQPCSFCVFGDDLHIIKRVKDNSVEIRFNDVVDFQIDTNFDDRIRTYAIRMKEKCKGTCSSSKIEQCLTDGSMACLPKVFYSILFGYRPQQHMNGEYGDVAGQISTGAHSYEMKGIIKKNTKNTSRGKCKLDRELIEETLKIYVFGRARDTAPIC